MKEQEKDFQTSTISGFNLHTLSTEKFKTTLIQLHLALPLRKEDVTKAALIPYVLIRGSRAYPTELAIRQALDELYGATFNVELAKRGENQVLVFQMDIANSQYLTEDVSLLPHAFSLLYSILSDPLVVNEGFDEEFVRIEKESLRRRIDGIIDDKMRYANIRATEIMCEGEPYSLTSFGYKEVLEEITSKNLYQFYQAILRRYPIDFYVVGNINHHDIEEHLREKFKDFPRETEIANYVESTVKKVTSPRTVMEELEVSQGKLHIGFRTHTQLKDEDYIPMMLFNGLYGGYPHSKLFLNVREKASLAYYAISRLESLKGIMMVMSGIDMNNFEQAKSIILEQLEEMKAGKISDEEITQTKSVLANQLREGQDAARSLIDFHYLSLIGGRKRTLTQVLEEIAGVTKEQVIEAASKVELDLIYFLKGRGPE